MIMQISYEQAKAANERGEKVEYGPTQSISWYPMFPEFNWEGEHVRRYKFRLADPYAELKAAQAQGKVIQRNRSITSEDWVECPLPEWMLPPDRYRVKPAELKIMTIEAGKWRLRNGREAKVYEAYPDVIHGAILTNSGTWGIQLWGKNGKISGVPEWDLVAPWTDAPAPYDNWQHVPAWAQWQAMNESGFWCFYGVKPNPDESIWVQVEGGSGTLPANCSPTNFTGTWETSLQERPKL